MPELETDKQVVHDSYDNCDSCVNLCNHIDDAEDRAMNLRYQNLIGLIILNLACWHGVTTHATSLDTWLWILAGSVVVLCRDIWASFDFANPLS